MLLTDDDARANNKPRTMKILIIRFSSFGDVLQCLSVAGSLRRRFPEAEIQWVTREDFRPLVESHPAVSRVWSINRHQRLRQLVGLAWRLRRQRFTHVYDAHNNLRSHVIGWAIKGFLDWRRVSGRVRFLRRPIYRIKRFLLFRFRINLFPQPFSGQGALLHPLRRWKVELTPPPVPQLFLPEATRAEIRRRSSILEGKFVALAPSAAFELKRWPAAYWTELIGLLPQTRFVLLGGPEDGFLREIAASAPERVLNLAGELDLVQSATVVALSEALIANDTGLMHVAEQIGKPCLALMGPAPFGFPSRPLTTVMEVPLWCRPCSKHGQGPCVNPVFHKCMRDIKPDWVLRELELALSRSARRAVT